MHPPDASDGPAAGVLLPATLLPALARQSVGHHLHVAELPSQALRPSYDVARDHGRPADPGA